MSNLFKQLKESNIKKEFAFDGKIIIVKNPIKEQQVEIQDALKKYVTINDGKVNIQINDFETLVYLYNELVYEQLEDGSEVALLNNMSNEEVKEVFDNPNELLEDINYEVSDIIRRLGKNSVREYTNQLEALESVIESNEMMKKIDELSKKGNLDIDLKEINWTPEIVNDESKKEIVTKPKNKTSRKKEVDTVGNI